MTWTQTRRRWQVLREIEQAATDGITALPWNEEYADLFGDRAALLTMLRYRWRLSYDAQVDSHLPEDVAAEQRRRLDERFAGIRLLLTRYGAWDGGSDVAA